MMIADRRADGSNPISKGVFLSTMRDRESNCLSGGESC